MNYSHQTQLSTKKHKSLSTTHWERSSFRDRFRLSFRTPLPAFQKTPILSRCRAWWADPNQHTHVGSV